VKILQIGKYNPPAVGGIESVVYEITEGLNKQQVEGDGLNPTTHYAIYAQLIKTLCITETRDLLI
jgi:glycosyltransferase involved in cell wall biosynthesis